MYANRTKYAQYRMLLAVERMRRVTDENWLNSIKWATAWALASRKEEIFPGAGFLKKRSKHA
jgi:hypothetical protein